MEHRKIPVEFTNKGVSLGGEHKVLLCASLFYFRLPREVWHERIAELKRTGYNCVDVYFPWNYHENSDGSFNFEGDRDIAYFLSELKEAGIYVYGRPGPYICSEWDGGALPARILESGMPIRCDNKQFIAEVKKWYDAVLGKIKPYLYSNGGTVIMLQLDNELDFFDCPDPDKYIGELAELVRKHCPDVPLCCCAGQYNVWASGGCVPGVMPALNCYPSSDDNTFDEELQSYALRFKKMNKPLLVTETNRDHFLLRRELSCGSKLLGAYNQVAGVNFGYSGSVNNWGSPDALLVSMYDFGSMIDPCGNYREEAQKGLLFASVLHAMGESIAAAVPCEHSAPVTKSDFKYTLNGLRVLELQGGGYAVCVANFTEQKGSIEFTYNGHSVKGEVGAFEAPFWLFDYPLQASGINGKIVHSTVEIIKAAADELVFNGTGEVALDLGDGVKVISRDGTVGGVKIKFVSGKDALEVASQVLGIGEYPDLKEYQSKNINKVKSADPPVYVPLGEGTTFGELGVTEGTLLFKVKVPAKQDLFIEGPCDLLRVDSLGKRGETHFGDGRDVIIPSNGNGEYTVAVHKWGHSNFDDSQSPAIRTSCRKGIRSFCSVVADVKIGRCDFKLLDEFGTPEIKLPDGIPVRISTDKWNSTRKPVVCSYSLPVKRLAERLVLKVGEATDVAAYIDGKKVSDCEYGTAELTPYVSADRESTLTIVYRKRVWTQNCTQPHLLHLSPVKPLSVYGLQKAQMLKMSAGSEAQKLPIKVKEPLAISLDFNTTAECRVVFRGKNLLIIGTAGGRVLGRAIAGWENEVALHGGEPNELYMNGKWGSACLYVEPLSDDAELCGIEILHC